MMDEDESYEFDQTLMYGRFTTTQLQRFAKDQAARLRREESIAKEKRRSEGDAETDDEFRTYQDSTLGSIRRSVERFRPCWSRLGSDWMFLLILGIIMALISFVLDLAIDKLQSAQIWLYEQPKNVFLQYLVWLIFPLTLVTFSVGFTYIVSPHAIGSGIPEMKVILRGTVLSRYLSIRTLIAKVIGLLTALGSSIPIGKEGPFVHIASMIARSMGKFAASFQGIYINESRNTEMLAAACAVGVSSCFGSPIGGVLFSIEVTATYFAVRNYWRGFFAAVCGAFVFRLLSVFDNDEETVTALFKTNFNIDFPFDIEEFIAFALIGVVCGFGGALFVFTHRKFVDIQRTKRHTKVSQFLTRNRFIYPAVVTFILATITFPQGMGQFMAGELTQKAALNELFSNFSWSTNRDELSLEELQVLSHWDGASTNIYVTLVIFIVLQFIMTAVAVALPIPAGIFFPVFLIGAAFGRLAGETMATWFPDGVRDGDILSPVVPGGYAVVGAAALSAAVTHTISTSVIVFELTGQIAHILPVMIAVLIANAIAQWLQPSFYDSIIQIKRLPYLPDLTKSEAYNLTVSDIMKTNLYYITHHSTYAELKTVLTKSDLRSYPLVDAQDSMILLGSVQRPHLQSLLNQHLQKAYQVGTQAESEDALFHREDQSVQEDGAVMEVEAQVSIPKLQGREDAANFAKPARSDKSLLSKISVPHRLHKLFGSGSNILEAERISEAAGRESPNGDQHVQWEQEILQKFVDFSSSQIDPAPFQLVERTSLLKWCVLFLHLAKIYMVHKLFALLNLSHAYVTTLGRLIGVVALKELREAIQGERYPDESSLDLTERSRNPSQVTILSDDIVMETDLRASSPDSDQTS